MASTLPAPGTSGVRGSRSSASGAVAPGGAASAADLPMNPPLVDAAGILAGVDMADPAQRLRALAELQRQDALYREALLAKAARLGVPLTTARPDGGVSGLSGFRGDQPLYRTTFNQNAAISSGASQIRQTAPYDLTGTNVKVGVWDGGNALETHQELTGRVTLKNPASPYGYSDHGTHVTGTVAASGVVDAAAKGMSPAVAVDSYDWDSDTFEMTAAGATGPTDLTNIPVSNHSYGADTDYVVAADLGRYADETRQNDVVAQVLPYYLQFWAAGNEQDYFTSKGGYESITFYQLAKNILTVGAVNAAVTGGVRDTNKATMSTFSSWGPCDDGRIKPDVVADGVGLYSTRSTSNTAYGSKSGTSMATPSATGSAALLDELYRREFSHGMRATLKKAILIHTADDLGNAGPDYKFGWGLINVKAAADLILKQKTDAVHPVFYEGEITDAAKEQTFNFTWDGVAPIRATLCWIDPPGTTGRPADDRTPVLVHNLNLKITAPDGTTTLYPFVMPFVGTWTTASMALPATTGVNNVDNVEQVYLAAPSQLGTYSVSVSLPSSDSLTTASQSYSLVLTGAGAPVNPPPVVAVTSPANGAVIDPSTNPTITVTATVTDLDADHNPGVISKVECFANNVSQGIMTLDPLVPDTYTLTFAPPGGAVTLRVTATDSESASASASVAIRYQYAQPGEVRPFAPPLADGTVRALAADGGGRIYIGGEFTKLNTSVDAPRVARLLADGSIDAAFAPGAGFDARVRVMSYDAGSSGLYAGGDFKNAGGVSHAALARLAVGKAGMDDGAADPDFAPLIEASSLAVTPFVGAIAVQGDGKILIGGNFSKINKVSRAFLARLLPDGSLDSSFAPVVPGLVNAIALQPDGKILIGGTFGEVNGVQRRNLARLNADGTLDTTLDVGTGSSGGFGGAVNSVAVAPGGDIYVGGSFSSYNGLRFYKNLAKLSSAGAIAPTFNYLDGLDNQVYDVHVRPDGRILVTGLFTAIGNRLLGFSTSVGRVAQLNSDGTLDGAFSAGTGANGSVLDSLPLPGGDILLAGAFTTFGGTARQNLAIITGYDAAKPIVTSPSFHTMQLGDQLDFAFTASASPATFAVTGTLPIGVSFDAATGRLAGIPLETGTFTLSVTATTPQGTGDPAGFVLQVNAATSPLTGFPAWIQAEFTAEELADKSIWAPDVVLNPLGLSNFAVYALYGGDPRSVPASALPVVSREPDGADTYLTLTAPKYPAATDVVYSVQYSSDLASWCSAPADVVVISETSTEIKARAAVPASAASRQFLRLKMLNAK